MQDSLASPCCCSEEFWLIFRHPRHRSFITTGESIPRIADRQRHLHRAVLCCSGNASRNAMRSILIFAAIMIAFAAVVPKLVRQNGSIATTAQATADRADATNYPRTASVRRGANGQFEAGASVDGRRMGFMIDTGASVIALRQRDAARLGIRPAQRDFTPKVTTADGVVFAAPAELVSVELDGILVHNAAAVVLPDEALAQNLLGMSFLSRIHWQYQGGRLILEQ
jgi:aspartyl protease family protein